MRRRGPSVVLLLLALAPSPSHAAGPPSGPPRLIADLADLPYEEDVELTILGELGGQAYFAAVEPDVSATLWRTDGTAAGTEPVVELEVCPARCGPFFAEPAVVDDLLYFVLGYHPFRRELWVTDGTHDGTGRLLRLEKPGSQIAGLTAVGDQLWFLATHPDLGEELWASDGTREGTRLLADLCPGACSSHPQWITPFDGRVAVVASGGSPGPFEHEFDLRLLDPATGEVEADGLCGGACGFTQRLAVHQGRLYFSALDEAHGEEPWVTDGTAAGTRLLMDGRPGPESGGLSFSFSAGGAVYLVALRSLDEPKVFRTDGTPGGTVPAEEILGALRGYFLNGFARPTAGGLFFSTFSEAEGEVLRAFDPGTGEVRGLRSGIEVYAEEFDHAALGGGIVFGAREQGFGREPWISDGTAAGTRRLADVESSERSSDPRAFTSVGGRVVFTTERVDHQHLWTTDGTPGGTVRIPLAPHSSSLPAGLTPYAGRLWFTARGDDGVRDLWRTTVTGDGAELVASGPFLPDLAVAHSSLFLRNASGDPVSLSLPDLAPVVLADTQPARELTAGPGGLTFFTTTGRGQELWASDGTPAGTRLVVDVDPDWIDPCTVDDVCPPVFTASAIRMPDQLTPLGGHLYFRAPFTPGTLLFGLWRTDGTAEGTAWLPLAPVGVERIVALGDRLVFHAGVPGEDGGHQIWTVTPSGAIHGLTDLGSRPVGGLAAAGDAAYYLVETDEGIELHRTGGTIQSSREVALLAGTSRLSNVGEIVAAGGRVYFPVHTPELGTELWTSDGTAAGTGPVADLHPGPAGSNPTAATPAGPYLVFTADDGESGREPWVTDGTAAGTLRLADLTPGPGFTGPREYAVVGGSLYLDGDDGVRGQELWAFDSGAAGGGPPAGVPDDATGIVTPEYPGFRFWVRISAGGQVQPARRELLCLPETVCVSGALPGRSELFLRIVGPRPNGFLWPILVRFTTSRLEVWIEQVATGVLQHYVLDAATPGSDELDGLFDRRGFQVD